MSTTTFYVTKYFFTNGIQVEEGCETVVVGQGKRSYVSRSKGYLWALIGQDAFTTREEATQRAIEMCEKKLKALDKQRIKVAKLLDEIRS